MSTPAPDAASPGIAPPATGGDGGEPSDTSPQPSLVGVPDVVGDTEQAASEELAGLRFVVAAEQVEDPGAEPGTVVWQRPTGGDEVEQGFTVTIGVAVESPGPSVPDVSGRTAASASEILGQFALNVTGVTEEPSIIHAAGLVTRTDPAAETPITDELSGVRLFVSTGSPADPESEPEDTVVS